MARLESALLEGDAEYKSARLARARIAVETRHPTLARDLGLSPEDADALFAILAESELRSDAALAALTADQPASSAAMASEFARVRREEKQRHDDAIAARFGAARVAEIQEYEETQPSRQRVTTLSGVLSQAGAPMTESQSRALTALIISEQRRKEHEAQADPSAQRVSSNEREFASNRRILAAAAAFLSPEQIAPIKARFDRAEAGSRASGVIQQRMGEAPQPAPGQ